MFGKENQYGTVAGFNVRVKDEREKDRNHLVEVTFELPLTFELADEISPAIARDLYDLVKGENIAKPEISTLGMNLSPETQLMTIRTHPDLDPEVKIAGVMLRKILAKKGEGGAWLLAFTTSWTLGDPREAIVMIQRLKQGVYLTFTIQEPKLDLQGQADNTVDGEVVTATVDQGGNVTDISSRRGRGAKGDKPKKNRKRTPEAEAEAQEAEARRALPPAEDPMAGDDQPQADEPTGGDPASGDL